MKRKVNLLIGILLFISVFVFSQELYFIQSDGNYTRFREPDISLVSGKLMLSVDILTDFNAGVTSFSGSNKFYIINKESGDTLIVDPYTGISLNFLEKFDGLVMTINDKVFISADCVFPFLGFTYISNERAYVFKENSMVRLLNAQMNLRTVSFEFSSQFFDVNSMIKVDTKGNEADIKIFPANADDATIRGIILKNNDLFYSEFNIQFNVPVDYRIVKDGKTATIYFSHVDPYLEEIEVLSQGVQWYRKKEVFEQSTLKVTYLEVDLKEADVKIVPEISFDGMGSRDKLSNMVRKNFAIGGVNASYFDPSTNFPVGVLIKDGQIESEPFYYPRPFFVRTDKNTYHILEINTEIHLRVGGSLFLVKGVNKYSQNGDVIVYTDNFKKLIPQDANREYVVISDDKVISKTYTPKVPNGGKVIVFNPKEISKFIKIGDAFSMNFIVPGFQYKISDAVEGGPMLLSGGQKVEDTSSIRATYGQKIIEGRTPRTVLALSKDKVVFLVIDGYQTASSGLTYEELTDFLLKKGYSDAMCFDGGSSSVMAIGSRIVNQPSSGEPNIPVGILVDRND
ncbi:MAG TPA: phosphodiester glycosidase family protein [Thermotogota bacterium]|nr:phosphodiester glycosidase family protein [Thermotogota bacterium]HRW33747.1 phosphodiester glycosidase family protein [Thermotogota bacterium]